MKVVKYNKMTLIDINSPNYKYSSILHKLNIYG